jgi:hypothetical protein
MVLQFVFASLNPTRAVHTRLMGLQLLIRHGQQGAL